MLIFKRNIINLLYSIVKIENNNITFNNAIQDNNKKYSKHDFNALRNAFAFAEAYEKTEEHKNKVQKMLKAVDKKYENNYNDNDNINNNEKELKLNLDVSELSSYDSEETQDINLINNQEKKMKKVASKKTKKQISFNEWLKKKNKQKQEEKKKQKKL